MFSVIYKWKLKSGSEETFTEGWKKITELFYNQYNSKGSRLHKAEDGYYIAYAQWKKKEDWEADKKLSELDKTYMKMMSDSIEESFEPVLLEVLEDMLK